MRPLSDFPRAELAHKPTPLEFMPNLTRHLGGPDLYVKRDDCTGLAMGGNKARQLEFYLGAALEQGCTAVLITGAVQSNYVRSTAAAAAKLGLRCHVQLEDRVQGMNERYHLSGNVLLDKLLGAVVHHYPKGEDESGADRGLEEIADQLRAEGERPYVIHLSDSHEPLGALGYVDAARELAAQSGGLDLTTATLVVPSGSASTHAGLLVGLRGSGAERLRVLGVCVRRDARAQAARVLGVVRRTERLLAAEEAVPEEDVVTTDKFLAPGYGRPGPDAQTAMLVAARKEGLILDPVYTSKAFAGMMDYVRSGECGSGPVVFLHTGGTPALFGYGASALFDLA